MEFEAQAVHRHHRQPSPSPYRPHRSSLTGESPELPPSNWPNRQPQPQRSQGYQYRTEAEVHLSPRPPEAVTYDQKRYQTERTQVISIPPFRERARSVSRGRELPVGSHREPSSARETSVPGIVDHMSQ
jgi:hypothetical protein